MIPIRSRLPRKPGDFGPRFGDFTYVKPAGFPPEKGLWRLMNVVGERLMEPFEDDTSGRGEEGE